MTSIDTVPEFVSVEVRTLRELFSGAYRFELPWFQRAYAWDAEEVGRLLTHVSEAAESPIDNPNYLLGTLVIAKEPGDPATALIDGQQRIMTLTIIAAVLRDLEADAAYRAEIQGFIAGRDRHFRPQEGCAGFCLDYVQSEGATLVDYEDDRSELSDAENNILENRNYIKDLLASYGFGPDARWRLFGYLADRCCVVLHVFRDAEEAWRWLQREEETQHRFNATDKAKTSLTLAMPAQDREICGRIWDQCEDLLGADDLFELLGHLRLLKRRRFSHRPVESELAKEFALNKGGRAFMERHLLPTARRLVALRQREIGGAERDAIARSIDRATWIDEHVWVPAALHWLTQRGDGGETPAFLRRLERLVWLMRLGGMDSAKKQMRVIRLLADIDSGASPGAMKSLEAEAPLVDNVRRALHSDSFDRKHFAKPVLRLLCALEGTDPGPFEASRATVEHIYPQGQRGKGPWEKDFPSKSTRHHAHRLGNLTLLTQDDNHGADTKPWSEKRAVYAASGFALSRKLASVDRWTPAAVDARTAMLTAALFRYWEITT
jgi:hypothetical protein